MKLFAVFFVFSLGAVSALPKAEIENALRAGQERFIDTIIAGIIEDLVQTIVDAGLDPLVIDRADLDYALPVPTIFNVRGHVRDLLFRGLSNIVINELNVNLLSLRAVFNISLPELLVNIGFCEFTGRELVILWQTMNKTVRSGGRTRCLAEFEAKTLSELDNVYQKTAEMAVDSEVDANLFGANFIGQYSGRVVLQNIVVTGDVTVRIGIITGPSINNMDLTFKLGNLDSQVNLRLQGANYSNVLNGFLGETIPTILRDFEDDINTLISIVGKDIVESML